jgi:Delta7-sterol 5-desaturase
LDPLYYFLDKDFWNYPALIVAFAATIFIIVLVRYLVTAVSYQIIIRKIYTNVPFRKPRNGQIKKEIVWSTISSLIFALLSVATYLLFQKDYTQVYTEFTDHSIAYFLFSIVLILIMYETYYYWLHRWMHKPSVFKIVHKVHHQSMSPTVFTSFSFHPLEAILQFIFLPVVIMIIPIHYYALGIVLLLMTISAVINHSGVEIFPKKFTKHAVGKWMIGSTHHDLHHKDLSTNFGLYLTFWDKWMKTESERFEKQLDANQELVNRSRSPHRPSMDDRHT